MDPRRKFLSMFDGAVHYAPGATNDDLLKECGNCKVKFRGQNCPLSYCPNISIPEMLDEEAQPNLSSPPENLTPNMFSENSLVNSSLSNSSPLRNVFIPATVASNVPTNDEEWSLHQCLQLETPLRDVLDQVRQKVFLNPKIDVRYKQYFNDMLVAARELPQGSINSSPNRSPIFPPNISPISYPTPSPTPSPIPNPTDNAMGSPTEAPLSVAERSITNVCTICGFVVRNRYRSHLLQHMKTHEPQTTCGVCGKPMAQRSLAAHAKTCQPTNRPRHVCTLCGKSYAKARILKAHTKAVHSTL